MRARIVLPHALLSAVVLCLLAAARVDVAPQASVPTSPPLSAQDIADMAYVRDGHARTSYSALLDFADPVHHRYFLRQLALANIMPDRFPQLYRSIEETRQAHIGRGRLPSVAIPPCPQDTVCPVNILSTMGSPSTNPTAFNVSALSSIPNSPDVAMNVVGLYQNNAIFAGPHSVEQNGTGYDVVNSLSGAAPSPGALVSAQGVWYYQPQGGGGIPGTFFAQSTPGAQPTIVNTSPTNVKGNNQIKICVTRQDSDCDYWYAAQGGQFIVKFPVEGNVTYPAAIQADANNHPANAISSVTVSQPTPNLGGGCAPLPINQPFINFTTVSNTVVSWTVNPAQFGVATPCFPSNTTVIYDLMLTVFDVNNVPWLISITSAQGAPVANQLRIQPTVVVYGCVAEGTLVTMADETKKSIETIGAGERVRSNAARIPLTVDNYTRGFEKTPMIAIETANGRHLLLTDGHPVITATGVKVGRDLRIGDLIMTDAGPSRLTVVAPREYDGNVWNLDVGRPTDHVRLTDTNTTFYANGILVGDGRMQGRLDRAHHESPAQVLQRLDPRWHVDFRSSEERRQQRRRQGL